MTTIQQPPNVDHRPPSPSPSQLPPVPASPTYSYASTTAQHHHNHPPGAGPGAGAGPTMTMNMNNMSAYSLPLPPPPPAVPHAVLTKSDLAASQQAYAELLTTAKSYRVALAALSTASSAFGSALEACARLKEARADSLQALTTAGPAGAHTAAPATARSGCTADALLAAAGVHHLVANHKQILSETVYRAFEVPLLHELDKWRRDVEDEEARYLAAVRRQSQAIRRLEKDGARLQRQRGPRDVARLRAHLVGLTTELDGLTALHGEHARTLLREGQDTSVKIVEAACSLVRAEVDIFEALARKGWSGGGLEDILERGQDLFAPSEEDDAAAAAAAGVVGGSFGGAANIVGVGDDAKLFSILPPKSILADTTHTMAGDLLAGPGGGEHYGNFTRGRSSHLPYNNGNNNNHHPGVGGGHHQRADSLGVASEPYQSLTGAVTTPHHGGGDIDAASIFSADFTTTSSGRPRMTRPFSPQPVRVRPEDVMGGSGDESDSDAVTGETPLHNNNNTHDNGDDDEKRSSSSPSTIREEGDTTSNGFMSSGRRRRLPRRRNLSPGATSTTSSSSREETQQQQQQQQQGDEDEDDEEEEEEEEHPWGNAKRLSSAASDPEERERRWNTHTPTTSTPPSLTSTSYRTGGGGGGSGGGSGTE